jgi:hypothetical protein
MISVLDIQQKALKILLKDTFSLIYDKQYKAYSALAKENAILHNMRYPERILFFTYGGDIYPNCTPNGTPVNKLIVLAPFLHHSLFTKRKEIADLLDHSQYNSIRNFFIAVLKESNYGIVLNTFLPNVLINVLQKELDKNEYLVLNYGDALEPGTTGLSGFKTTVEETKQHIENIHQHYDKTKEQLKNILMERFLLQ